MGPSDAPRSYKVVSLKEFDEPGHDVGLPWPRVKRDFQELSEVAFLAFQRPKEKFDVHFHFEDVACGGQVSEHLWNHGYYQDQLEEHGGLLFAHFLERTSKLQPSSTRVYHGAEQAVPSSPPSMEPYADQLDTAEDQDSAHDTPMTDATYELTPGPAERCEVHRDNRRTTRQGGNSLNDPDARISETDRRSRSSSSRWRPPPSWPDDIVEVTFCWKARTEGIPKSFRRFAVDLHEASAYEEIVQVVEDELTGMVSRSARLAPYLEDIRWELYLGATESSLRRLREDMLLKDYESEAAKAPRTLVAHMHIRVWDNGKPLERLELHSEYQSRSKAQVKNERKSLAGLRSFVGEMKQSPHALVLAEATGGGQVQFSQVSKSTVSNEQLDVEGAVAAHGDIRYFAEFAKFEDDETETRKWILQRMRAGYCVTWE